MTEPLDLLTAEQRESRQPSARRLRTSTTSTRSRRCQGLPTPRATNPDPDDLTRAELAESYPDVAVVAEVLDDWLHRNHGILSSHHHAGDFLDELAARGWQVAPMPAVPSLDELLPPSKD